MTEAASAVLVESTIADCVGFSGGALFVLDQANVTVKGGAFERCAAARGGGFLAFNGDVALLEGSVISQCHAGAYGGGLHHGLVVHSPTPVVLRHTTGPRPYRFTEAQGLLQGG